MSKPVTTLDPRYSDPSASPTSWEATRRQLEEADLSWLVTVRSDGRPHATPVVAVWVDDAIHFTTGDKEQKADNLRAGDRVLVQTGRLDWQGGIDVVVEGRATLAVDETLLRQLAGSFRARWDGRWAYELRDGSLHHSAGFPVLTYSVRPEKVLAFAQGTFGQTVHRFPPG
jgi:general stress protein 26